MSYVSRSRTTRINRHQLCRSLYRKKTSWRSFYNKIDMESTIRSAISSVDSSPSVVSSKFSQLEFTTTTLVLRPVHTTRVHGSWTRVVWTVVWTRPVFTGRVGKSIVVQWFASCWSCNLANCSLGLLFDLAQLNRAWIIMFFDADTLRHAVILIFDLLTLNFYSISGVMCLNSV